MMSGKEGLPDRTDPFAIAILNLLNITGLGTVFTYPAMSLILASLYLLPLPLSIVTHPVKSIVF